MKSYINTAIIAIAITLTISTTAVADQQTRLAPAVWAFIGGVGTGLVTAIASKCAEQLMGASAGVCAIKEDKGETVETCLYDYQRINKGNGEYENVVSRKTCYTEAK